MLVDEIILNCEGDYVDSLLKFVKEKKDYVLYNLTSGVGYYTISIRDCDSSKQILEGTLLANGSTKFTPTKDGEYTVIFTVGEERQKMILSHYPAFIKSIVTDLKQLLCNDHCSCDCDADEQSCRSYQNLFGDITLLLSLYKPIKKCKTTNIIRDFIDMAVDLHRCSFINLFCSKELDKKVEGHSKYSDKMFKRLMSINYLSLYYYELMVNSPIKENVDYVNKLFGIKYLKDCITSTGINLTDMETIFTYLSYCEDTPDTCDTACIIPLDNPEIIKLTYFVGDDVTGIPHISTIKNRCLEESSFIDRLIYKDTEFKVKAINTTGTNPLFLLSGDIATVNLVLEGTKSTPIRLIVPFKYKGILINTYDIEFVLREAPNDPPVITAIYKELENRQPYYFTIADFENHFSDPNNDSMGKVELVGDTSRFRFNGIPYISGTPIDRVSIVNLAYLPNDTDDEYGVSLFWKAYDEHGLESN